MKYPSTLMKIIDNFGVHITQGGNGLAKITKKTFATQLKAYVAEHDDYKRIMSQREPWT